MGCEQELNSTDLLSCFFAECENAFNFLSNDHNYRHLCGLAHYTHGHQIISPYINENEARVFQAVTRYEIENRAIEILYRGPEFFIEAHLYINQIHRISFHDLLLASKVADERLPENIPATEVNHIKQATVDLAKALKSNKRYFLKANDEFIDRALSIRAKRMEHHIREQYKHDLERASKNAAKAFRNKNYKRVIEIFLPFEKDLSSSDLKKMKISRQELLLYY